MNTNSLFRIWPLLIVAFAIVIPGPVVLAAGENFEPTSILTPIREIALSSSVGGSNGLVYECPGSTGPECLVDISDPAALAALTTAVTVSAGTYDVIRVGSCKEEGQYDTQLKGSVTIGGTPYVTGSGADPLLDTTGRFLTPEYVTVTFSGCSTEIVLPEPLVVADGDDLNISLFISTVNIAWAQDSAISIPSGCKTNAGGTMEVCLAYPDVVPYVGVTTPVLEAYHVTRDGTGDGGQVLLIFDVSDNLLGGFTRPLYVGTNSTDNGYDTPLRIFVDNGDGTYHLENYGSTATTSYLNFPAFGRTATTSTGSFIEVDTSNSVPYTATRQ